MLLIGGKNTNKITITLNLNKYGQDFKIPNRNSPASKEKMEELLIANEEFNKKEDEFDKVIWFI